MDFKDYYKVLQVEPEADAKAIKTAYRKLARKYHPDVSKEKDAETQFKEVSEAYEVLHNPEKRAEYDELRKYGRQGQPFQGPPGWQPRGRASGGAGTQFFDEEGGDFSDFFSNIFGASGRGGGFNGRAGSAGRRGQDVEMELPVSLEETLSDEPKAVSFQVGQQPGKTLNVKIPVGVVDGERIRLKGQGGAGAGGGANGDLYLVIKLAPHPLFDLEGQDLIITVALAPWEAALGAKVAVPTLSGRINMTIPANSQAGQRLRVKGRGLRNKQGGQGDLYAQLKVVMPKAGDDATEQLWRELAEKAAFDPRSEWSK